MENVVKNVCSGTCPKCHKGKVFEEKGGFLKLKLPKMYQNCTECGYKFEKEPGYFYGAMYVSYMLTVGEAIALYMVLAYIFQLSNNLYIFFVIAASMIGLSFFNMRLSRILWMHLFKN